MQGHEDDAGVLYLLQEREFLRAGEPVFKMGRSADMFKRLAGYPKKSRVLLAVHCPSVRLVETETRLIRAFAARFRQRRDIGREYFEGDVCEMARLIWEAAATWGLTLDQTVPMDVDV